MKSYKNIKGTSGVSAYETGKEHILVWFGQSDRPYRYSHDGAGRKHVEKMKKLAKKGKGLSTYISQYVHDLYDH